MHLYFLSARPIFFFFLKMTKLRQTKPLVHLEILMTPFIEVFLELFSCVVLVCSAFSGNPLMVRVLYSIYYQLQGVC